jgi:hypothetical protein
MCRRQRRCCFLSLNKGLAEWMDTGNTIRGWYRTHEYNGDGNNTGRRGETGNMDSIRDAGMRILNAGTRI